MQNNKIRNRFYIFSIVLLSLITVIPDFKADVVAVKYTGVGNLFPDESCSLIMTNASVSLTFITLSNMTKYLPVLMAITLFITQISLRI